MSPRAPLRVLVNPVLEGPRLLRSFLAELAEAMAKVPSGTNAPGYRFTAAYLAGLCIQPHREEIAEGEIMWALRFSAELLRAERDRIRDERRSAARAVVPKGDPA